MIDIWQATLDYYGPNRYKLYPYLMPQKAKFAVICPGGGYGTVCSFSEGKPYAKRLNELGYSAFVLRYRTRKKGRYPAPMDDLARAVKYILENSEKLNVETGGYSVWGSSAGGHLAASFGTQNMGYAHYGLPKPAALVLTYPVISMEDYGHPGSAKNLLGKGCSRALVDETSVEKQLWPGFPPTFVWSCWHDGTVDCRNSQMLAEGLAKQGVLHKLMLFDDGKHGSGLATGTTAETWFSNAIEFWETMM